MSTLDKAITGLVKVAAAVVFAPIVIPVAGIGGCEARKAQATA